MAYDLYGEKPTAPEGEYFRRTVWDWPVLADFCVYVAPKETRPCKHWYGPECYGRGLNAKQSAQLAHRLEQVLATGLVEPYSLRFVDFRLHLSEASVRGFLDFLRACGGFKIT